jgi:flagellar biosynthesis/type III secretory pathway protein FliH
MSSRATRVSVGGRVEPFVWADVPADYASAAAVPFFAQGLVPAERAGRPANGLVEEPARPDTAVDKSRFATLEREAFATAYAQGEKAGVEAGTTRADAMLRRLSDTLRELEELRRSMIRQTEHQIVQLAIEMARRIVRREVQTDNDLLCAMARVALDRLGDASPATIRLNPEDYHTIVARQGGAWAGSNVNVVADPSVGRGGCMVESPFGFVDASVEAQFRVLEQALLAEDGAPAAVVNHGLS